MTDADEITMADITQSRVAMIIGKSEPQVPTEIEFGEEQEFEAYEAIVLKRALANSRHT